MGKLHCTICIFVAGLVLIVWPGRMPQRRSQRRFHSELKLVLSENLIFFCLEKTLALLAGINNFAACSIGVLTTCHPVTKPLPDIFGFVRVNTIHLGSNFILGFRLSCCNRGTKNILA